MKETRSTFLGFPDVTAVWKTRAGYTAFMAKHCSNLGSLVYGDAKKELGYPLPKKWYCGYVVVDRSHPLYGKDIREEEFPMELETVHRGITISVQTDDNRWVFGFDTMNLGDSKRGKRYVSKECAKLSRILKSFEQA